MWAHHYRLSVVHHSREATVSGARDSSHSREGEYWRPAFAQSRNDDDDLHSGPKSPPQLMQSGKCPHSRAQGSVSQEVLDSVKLAINNNHYTNIVRIRQTSSTPQLSHLQQFPMLWQYRGVKGTSCGLGPFHGHLRSGTRQAIHAQRGEKYVVAQKDLSQQEVSAQQSK